MESPGQDGLQNDGHAARVEWPVKDSVDDLELLFFGEGSSGSNDQLEVLGGHLYSTVEAALTLISNSRRAELINNDFEADGDNFVARTLSWKSTSSNLIIQIRTVSEEDVTSEHLGDEAGAGTGDGESLASVVSSNDVSNPRCRINGPDDWNSVVSEKLGVSEGKVEVVIFHDCEVGSGDSVSDLQVFHRFIFPDIRV